MKSDHRVTTAVLLFAIVSGTRSQVQEFNAVIVIILAVVFVAIARVKGMLCFAAKNSDDSDPEKEAFDNAEKGETAPIVSDSAKTNDNAKISANDNANNSTPEKKATVVTADETKPDTKDEDKKSNGTTPV